ncbi:unnamed protein product [Amoebophrya sp. A120]|nr:unnamed protein product [Amoebophrya sp. A120]|eukprot:GSA120T00012832001.1
MSVPAGPLCTSLSNIRKAPKWTLTGREEDKVTARRNKLGPGPGGYHVQDINVDARHSRPPSAVFSHEKRDAFTQAPFKKPSVGTYTPNFFLSSTMPASGRTVFSKSSRDDAGSAMGSARRAQTPGPGTYAFKPALSDISASMYGRAKDFKRPTTPGPGAYTISRDLIGPAWKMPTHPEESTESRARTVHESDDGGLCASQHHVHTKVFHGSQEIAGGQREITFARARCPWWSLHYLRVLSTILKRASKVFNHLSLHTVTGFP